MTKEHLHSYIDLLNDEQINKLSNILTALLNRNYFDLAKALGIDLTNVDSARPQAWSDKMRNEMGLQPAGIVWDYRTNKFGEPFNLFQDILGKLFNSIRVID